MFGKIVTCLLVAHFSIHAADPVKLFNGKDFAGWLFENIDPKATPESIWSVADGILICKGRPPGVMRTSKDYSNYELVVEWRWAPGSKPENSGILVHASTPKQTFVWPKSLEVQLGHGDAGDFWMIGETVTVAGKEASAKGRRWIKNSDSTEKTPGDWNVAKVRCDRDKITVWINGTLQNEGTQASASKGAICLQAEGGEIHFRKVELTPIE